MTRDPIERRRRARLMFAVLAVGLVVSAIVAGGLIYLGQRNPGF